MFLVDWGVPDELEAGNTLETYTDGYLPEIVREVVEITGQPEVNVFGYCFGGVLSLLSLAGNPDLPVRSLAVQAVPVDYEHMGPMATMMQEGRVDPAQLVDATGNVPADVMLNSFRVLKPTGDITGYVNLWQNLWNDDFVAAHQTMTQWSRDHIPFPGAAFVQTGQLFARDNLLATGTGSARRPRRRPRRHHRAVPQHHRGEGPHRPARGRRRSRRPRRQRRRRGAALPGRARRAHRRPHRAADDIPQMAEWLERHAQPLGRRRRR